MNLYEKILAVSMEIKNIEKNMKVGTGNYAYQAVSDIDVTLKVKEAEEKFKLVSIPIKQELINSEVIRTLKEGNKESLTFVDTVKMTVRVIDLEEPTQFIEVESFGKGIDSGDKGFGKASTYARKYALMNLYKIATGQDPDEAKSKEQQAIKPIGEKRIQVVNYLNANVKKIPEACKYFGVESIEDLSDANIDILFKNFEAKSWK